MAYRDPNAPIVARLFATNVPNHERIEIDSYRSEGPNIGSQIRFYKEGQSSSGADIERASKLLMTANGLDPSIDSVLQLLGGDHDLNGSRASVNLYDMTDGSSELTLASDRTEVVNGITNGPFSMMDQSGGGSAPEAWKLFAFANGWSDLAGSRAGYWMDSSGVVHLRGLVIGGTAGLPITVLPFNYLPTQSMDFTMRSNGGFIVCAIGINFATGAITATANSSTVSSAGVKIDGITWPTR